MHYNYSMHETLAAGVKGYIDSLHSNGFIRGWAFHEEKGVIRLRISDLILTPVLRTDVAAYYDGRRSLKLHCGGEAEAIYQRHEIALCGFESIFPSSLYSPSIVVEAEIESGSNDWVPIFRLPNPSFQPLIRRLKSVPPSFVVIDDFYEDPDAVRAFALAQNFDLHPAYHKGQRTDACFRFNGLKEAFETIIGTKIGNWTKYGTNGCFQFCKGGDELVYHYDTQEYAGVLFLTPDAPPSAGTSFFRSKNGSNDRSIRRIDSSANIDAIFPTGFLDPSLFDVVDVVGNVYNRLVLFDAKLIHAASSYFGNSKENGRLFQLFFFDIDSETS